MQQLNRNSPAPTFLWVIAVILLCIPAAGPAPAWAQQATTSQGPPNPGESFVIDEGETVATLTGAQTRVFSTILHPDPTDPTRATDPKTGRNFNWDPDKKSWVNSQTGQSVHAVGYFYPSSQPRRPLLLRRRPRKTRRLAWASRLRQVLRSRSFRWE